ncbi:MAG TPA: TolC family protein [Ignavibacteria bacterium]|nr:TolC family protein [Ignavibacteria bacterium]HMQ99749.1 TolC family protein [Ignavibacteria bacterium]
MKIFKLSVLIIALNITGSLYSQEIQVSLKEAIEHAYKNDPNINKLENTIELQESSLRANYGNLFPDLKFSTGWTRSNTVINNSFINQNGIPIPESNETSNNFSLSLRSDVTIFDGMTNFDKIDLAKQTKTQYQIQLRQLKQDIAVKIISSYIAVLKNQQIVVINEATLADSRAQLDRIKIFVEVGKRTLSDVYQQDVVVAQNELLVEQAKNNLNKSISDLAYNSNLPLEKNYAVNPSEFNTEIAYENLEAYVIQNQNTEGLVSNAFRNRYDIKARVQNLDLLQTNIDIARGTQYFPTLTGFGSYSMNGNKIDNVTNQRTFTIGLNLSYPIFQGFQLDYQRQIALINYKSAQEDIKLVKNQVELQIKKAIQDLRSLLKQIEITDRNLVNAQQNKLLAEESYRVGIGTVLDVNTATTNLNNILINKSNLIYDFINAQKTLEYYQGILNY